MNNGKILLIEPNKFHSTLYSINLSSKLGIEVIPSGTIAEAANLLDILSHVRLVIVKNSDEGLTEFTPEYLIDLIEAKRMGCKIIVFGKQLESKSKQVKMVTGEISPDKMVEVSRKELDMLPPEPVVSSEQSYLSFNIDFIRHFSLAPVEIYITVGEGKNQKYIKRFNRDAAIEEDYVDKYKKKGLESLHIKREDKDLFTEKVTQSLLDKLRKVEEQIVADMDVVIPAQQIVFEQLTMVNEELEEKLEQAGFKLDDIKLANKAIASVLKTLEKSGSFVGTLSKIYQSLGSFSYRHCYMAGIVSFNILKKCSWARPQHFETLMFTCFFHDVVLDKDELMALDGVEELERGSWSDKEKEKTLKHALLASKYVLMKKNFPPEADVVILHHHGSEVGIGYNKIISEKIHRLAQIFIIAEAFILQLTSSVQSNIDVKKIMKNLSEMYSGPNVPFIIQALIKALVSEEN